MVWKALCYSAAFPAPLNPSFPTTPFSSAPPCMLCSSMCSVTPFLWSCGLGRDAFPVGPTFYPLVIITDPEALSGREVDILTVGLHDKGRRSGALEGHRVHTQSQFRLPPRGVVCSEKRSRTWGFKDRVILCERLISRCHGLGSLQSQVGQR